MALDIQETEGLRFSQDAWYYDTHGILTPAYNILLAWTSSMLGVYVYDVAQIATAIIAIFSVVAGYLIAVELTGSKKCSVAVALTLSLFGTLVFLTGSSWKSAIGFALLGFLLYSFLHRSDRRFLAVELVILAALPLVHHLAMAVGYLCLGYLTIITAFLARKSGAEAKRQTILDITILAAFSLTALVYYQSGSLDRLSIVLSQAGLVNLAIAFAFLCAISSFLLSRKRHLTLTLAPTTGIIVFVLFSLDRSGALFGHGYSGPDPILVLGVAVSLLVAVSWFGLERVQMSRSLHKVVPFALLLPVLTLFMIAAMNGLSLQSHQIFYRSFDFADLVLALGIGFAFKRVGKYPSAEAVLAAVLICALLITFPFGYASGTLTGVRHDTQAYEVDAVEWLYESFGEDAPLQTDERLGYIALALFNFDKEPHLPDRLDSEDPLLLTWVYMYEEEWSETGVNNYPEEYVIVDSDKINGILLSSDVIYVGGPSDNNVILFSLSSI
ncbi:MAG: hypothetical protein JSV90_03915 [Methanobacteriota archaeon]|nr:MAG: hypothetical protein JSV90_03915 [Euryarchaeota archaeon]